MCIVLGVWLVLMKVSVFVWMFGNICLFFEMNFGD